MGVVRVGSCVTEMDSTRWKGKWGAGDAVHFGYIKYIVLIASAQCVCVCV